MHRVIQTLVTLKRGVCMGLFNLLLHLREVYVCGYSTACYTLEGCMFGAIQPLVTLKRGVCIALFNHLLHLRGVHVWGYSTTCYT